MADMKTGIVFDYNGYQAKTYFDNVDKIFVGRVVGIKDVIGFHGESIRELENNFHEAIDDYLAACVELRQKPNAPYQGKISLRMPPDLHAKIANAAELNDKSINQWIVEALESTIPSKFDSA